MLVDCDALEHINVAGLHAVESISYCFLDGCSRLTNIDFGETFSSLKSIGCAFLSFGPRKKDNTGVSTMTLNISSFRALTCVGDGFLSGNLNIIALEGLSDAFQHVTSIGACFLFRCSNLKSLDLSVGAIKRCNYDDDDSSDTKALAVISIGHKFCFQCSSLTSVNLSGLTNLERIDGEFLSSCCAVEHVDLSGMRSLKQIGPHFLNNCRESLQILDCSAMRKLEMIGERFLAQCVALRTVVFGHGPVKLPLEVMKKMEDAAQLVIPFEYQPVPYMLGACAALELFGSSNCGAVDDSCTAGQPAAPQNFSVKTMLPPDVIWTAVAMTEKSPLAAINWLLMGYVDI